MKATFRLANQAVRDRVIDAIRRAPEGFVVVLSEETRTLEQNAKLWPVLTDISRQVEWYGRKLRPEDWKHIFTAALQKQDVVPGLDGKFVVLGLSTSQMPKKLFSDLLELALAFGSEKGVRWSETVREEAA